jgi:hypothetical protein
MDNRRQGGVGVWMSQGGKTGERQRWWWSMNWIRHR